MCAIKGYVQTYTYIVFIQYVTCDCLVNVSAGKIILIDFAKRMPKNRGKKKQKKIVPINLRAKAIKTFAFIIN